MILCVHFDEPNWPADSERPRYAVTVDGRSCWIETDGSAPSSAEIDAHFNPPASRREVDKADILDRLTDAQLAAALAAMTPRQKERWRMPGKPAIYADDPELLAMLTAIGADQAVVLA